MLQKLKLTPGIFAIIALLTTAVPLVGVPPAFAAKTQPKGTCFYNGPGTTKTQIKSCKSLGVTTQQEDSDNKAVSYSKCYEVNATTSSETITQVNCDGSSMHPVVDTSNDTVAKDKCTGLSPNEADCNTVVDSGDCTSLSKCDLMSKYINPLINFLAALVGIVVVISIIIGGIQYSSSAGDPQAATAAKNRIRNAIIALVVFIFLYALLNFLIPGGLG